MRRLGISMAALGLVLAGCTSDGQGGGLPFGSSTTAASTSSTGQSGVTVTTSTGTTVGFSTVTSTGDTQPDATTTTTTGGSTSSTEPTSTTEGATTTTTSTAALADSPARPVPIREGLASFDFYEFRFSTESVGPTAQDSTAISTTIQVNSNRDARRTVIESTIISPEDGTSSSIQEIIQIGRRVCTFDGDAWSFERLTAQQRELADIAAGLIDLVFSVDDGVFVGPEEIAGLPSRHYRYSLPGLGQESGALVVENQIDYWVSDDGNVLVKYRALVETRDGPSTDPDAEVLRIDTAAELISANERQEITLPEACPVS